ncbi:MAG TPA: glucose 1-dehydrogenase [Blastocatellia bacterium]|nr:glucose 1-dehydrogenase [Blastocatellia bacterium]
MSESWEGKRILVTGASSGIGTAAAELFIGAGASVALAGRREGPLLELSKKDSKGRAFAIVGDLAKDADAEMTLTRAVEQLGGLDVLVNSAGIIGSGSVENTTPADWDRMMNINLRSVFLLTKLAAPHLEASKGNIVNVSSVAGVRCFPGVAAYCVSKAALDQLTRCSALDLAPKGIRVNAVNPGVVVTGLHRSGGMSAEAYASFLEHSKETHPLGRWGEASEIAELIFFLASEKAGWITGAIVSIDGGRALTCLR